MSFCGLLLIATATYEDGRNRREEALIDTEEQSGNLGGALRRDEINVHEAKVLEVANEEGAGLREGERVAPKEPAR